MMSNLLLETTLNLRSVFSTIHSKKQTYNHKITNSIHRSSQNLKSIT